MSEAVVEVPHDEIDRFQLWLASQAQEVTHGVERQHVKDALDTVKNARLKLEAVEALLEQGERASTAGEAATYRGDSDVLLWNCDAMADDYALVVGKLGSSGPHDYGAIQDALEPLSRWLGFCREIQASNPEAVAV